MSYASRIVLIMKQSWTNDKIVTEVIYWYSVQMKNPG